MLLTSLCHVKTESERKKVVSCKFHKRQKYDWVKKKENLLSRPNDLFAKKKQNTALVTCIAALWCNFEFFLCAQCTPVTAPWQTHVTYSKEAAGQLYMKAKVMIKLFRSVLLCFVKKSNHLSKYF